jgi:AcrR family transcriptional regulator
MPEVRRKQQRSIDTQRKVLRVARRLFARKGFSGTSTGEILERAGISRGALYHHYASKQDILQAVFEELQEELAERVRQAAAAERRPERTLRAAADGFLDACLDRDVQQIVLIDAPSVLPWSVWQRIQSEHVLGVLVEVIEQAIAERHIDRQPAEALANVLLGTLTAGGLNIARDSDRTGARRRVGKTVRRLLDGLSA